MENKDKSILLKIAIVAVGLFFIYQSGFDFGLTKNEASANEAPAKEVSANEVSADTTIKESKTFLMENPLAYSQDFELLLQAYNKAWVSLELDVDTYALISDNEKVLNSLNWLMDYRKKGMEVPEELKTGINEYIGKDGEKEKRVAAIFSENKYLKLMREYTDNDWKINLKYVKAEESSSGGTENSASKSNTDDKFKNIGLD